MTKISSILKRERLPYTASSKAWSDYWEVKQEKQKKELIKKKKLEIRETNVLNNGKILSGCLEVKASTSKIEINDCVFKERGESLIKEYKIGINKM